MAATVNASMHLAATSVAYRASLPALGVYWTVSVKCSPIKPFLCLGEGGPGMSFENVIDFCMFSLE
jgi:hypothetical protein